MVRIEYKEDIYYWLELRTRNRRHQILCEHKSSLLGGGLARIRMYVRVQSITAEIHSFMLQAVKKIRQKIQLCTPGFD